MKKVIGLEGKTYNCLIENGSEDEKAKTQKSMS